MMTVAIGLFVLPPNIASAQGNILTLAESLGGISGNILLGGGNVQGAFLYNDISNTTTYLNTPAYSTASGMSGNYVVGTYASSFDHGFLYNITTGTYITLDDPLASTKIGTGPSEYPYGTELSGIYGDNIVGDYYDSSGLEHGFLYNITNQTWTNLDYAVTGIYGNYIIGNNGLNGVFFNGATWSTITVPGSTISTGAYGIFGTEIVGAFNNGTGASGYVYNLSTGTFTYPFTLSQFPVAIPTEYSLFGISGSTLMGTYNYLNPRTGDRASSVFLYTVPEISSIWLVAVPLVGVLFLD